MGFVMLGVCSRWIGSSRPQRGCVVVFGSWFFVWFAQLIREAGRRCNFQCTGLRVGQQHGQKHSLGSTAPHLTISFLGNACQFCTNGYDDVCLMKNFGLWEWIAAWTIGLGKRIRPHNAGRMLTPNDHVLWVFLMVWGLLFSLLGKR